MVETERPKQVLRVQRSIVEPSARPIAVRAKKIGDFPGASRAHLEVAQKLTSPFLNGPPLCDELVALVQHVFTEEEAGVVRHLGVYRGQSAAALARAEHRPLDEVAPILHQLAEVKRVIGASGPAGEEKYRMMGVLPGIFEMSLISETAESMSPWHRRLAELVEALYQTGYYGDYATRKIPGPFVRTLSVGRSIEAHPMALPSDRLEVVLDRYDVFGVGQCQCRTTQQVVGKGCGKPIKVCTVMGQWAEKGVEAGYLTRVSKSEVLAIKRDAEENGLVTWILNIESTKGQCSCSCCPCCCYALRMINDFNAPGVMAPAHFVPEFVDEKCIHCGKCAKRCPTQALSVEPSQKTRTHRRERCIGCGLCMVACGDRAAIAMQPVPDYKLPYRSWFSIIASTTPRVLKNAWDIWRSR